MALYRQGWPYIDRNGTHKDCDGLHTDWNGPNIDRAGSPETWLSLHTDYGLGWPSYRLGWPHIDWDGRPHIDWDGPHIDWDGPIYTGMAPI